MVCWQEFKVGSKSKKSVSHLVNEEYQRLVSDNRHYLKTVAEVLMLTRAQCISQRGHDESEGSINQGNFLEILKLIAKHDSIVHQKINGPKNATYTHHSVQNSMIEIMADLIRKEI